jgi:hypothetical protein
MFFNDHDIRRQLAREHAAELAREFRRAARAEAAEGRFGNEAERAFAARLAMRLSRFRARRADNAAA